MADGVDATVNSMKSPRPHAVLDLCLREARLQQLGEGDDAMLAPRHSGDSAFDRLDGALCGHAP